MPRPTVPELTPYEEQLPDVNNPATWVTRTPLFWNWVTGPGYTNLDDLLTYSEAAIDFIDTALVGSETLVDAVAALQSLINNCVLKFRGSIASIPAGWQLCDGTNGTPDLRDKFIVGAGGAYAVGETGGADSVTLTEAQMPAHTHFFNQNTNASGEHDHGIRSNHSSTQPTAARNGSFGLIQDGASAAPSSTNFGGNHAHNVQGNTDSKGSSQAHENRPPYYALAYIAKV